MAGKQALIIVVLATVLGLTVNLFSPAKIPYVGAYRSISDSGDPVVPPAAMPGDPPFIGVDVAQLEYNAGNVLFVDAREPEEFECGTIAGAINVPFDYLPDDNLEQFFDSTLNVPKDYPIITFCSGEECDLSLQLARNLQAFGYTNISIFFGGWRQWKKLNLPIERRRQCDG